MHGFDFGFSSFTSGRWYIFIVDFSSYFWFAYCTLRGSYLILNILDFDCYGFIMSINYKEMSESSSFVVLLIEEQRWMKNGHHRWLSFPTMKAFFKYWTFDRKSNLLLGSIREFCNSLRRLLERKTFARDYLISKLWKSPLNSFKQVLFFSWQSIPFTNR